MSESGLNDLNFSLDDIPSSPPDTRGRSRGRKVRPIPEPIAIVEVGEEEYQQLMGQVGTGGKDHYMVKNLRGSHHFILRAHVAGLKNREISRMSGYSEGMISQIIRSPLAQPHIEELREKMDDAVLDFSQRLKNIGMMSLDKIEEALEEDEVPAELALKMAGFAADRVGHGPSSTLNNKVERHDVLTQEHIVEIRESMRSRRINVGGGIELVDPAERRRQEALEMEQQGRLPEGPRPSQGSPADHGDHVPSEGAAPAPKTFRDSVTRDSLREKSWAGDPEELP